MTTKTRTPIEAELIVALTVLPISYVENHPIAR
jgi:hypothetical protein